MKSNKKTRKLTKGAAAAERVIDVDISPAQVDIDLIRLTSFGEDSTGPPPLLCTRDDALGDDGAAAPKLCLLPVERRAPTATNGSFPSGTASTAMRIIFPRWLFCWSLGETKKHIIRINYQLASFWRWVIQTKSRQTPGGLIGYLRGCPFLGGRHALRIGWVHLDATMVVEEAGAFLVHGGVEHHFPERSTSDAYVLRSIAVSHTESRQISTARGYESYGGEQKSGNAMDRGA